MPIDQEPFGRFIESFTIALNQTSFTLRELQEIQEKFSLAYKHSEEFHGLSIRELIGEEVWLQIEPSFLESTAKQSNSPRNIPIPLIDMNNPEHTKALYDLLRRQIEVNRLRASIE